MRRPLPLLLTLAALLAGTTVPAQDRPQRDFAVHCGRLLIGDGETELVRAWLVVRNGKIESLGQQAPPADLPVVDASDRVVMPGIVAVDTDLAAARDDTYAITPDVLAVDGFDFEAPMRRALEGGVTTAYLSPGRDRLVSGQGAVVKLAGLDLVARVLADSQCLRVNLDDSALRAPRLFEPTVHPTDDDPLEPARVQTPTARIAMLAELRALFASAREATTLQGDGPAETRYDAAALRAVLQQELPLRIAARQGADIRRALQLQQELGARVVLENPFEIGALASQASSQGVAAVFRLPVLLGQKNPGGEDRAVTTPQDRLDAPALAAAAGLPIGLAPAAGAPLRDYLLAVALAVRFGLPERAALRAIGQDASRILGVDRRVGLLAPGYDADFVVLSGDPLAIGTLALSTWIDGKCVYERRNDSELLAVRCGRILDGTGTVHRGGVLLAAGGRIKAVGPELTVPHGARVIDLPDAVMTPGFVDAYSHLGLAGQGQGVPQGLPDQALDQAIAFDDPMFAPALAAGVTTLLVSGKDGALLAGRVAAVKTGATAQDSMLVRAICGQRVVFDAIGPDSDRPLRDLLERGKKYAETWATHEKALADFRAGKLAAPAPKPAAPTETTAPPDPVTGTWEAQLDIRDQFQIKVLLDLQLAGTKVTGSVRMSMGQRELPGQDIEAGSFEGGRLRLEFRGMGSTAVLEGTIQNDQLDGTVTLGPMGQETFTAKRTAKTAGSAPKPTASTADADNGEPKPPATDHGLEPLRAVFEQRAALIVRVTRSAAIRSVLAAIVPLKIPFALQAAHGALDEPEVLQNERPPVLLEPDVVHEESGQLHNRAAAFADLALPVVIGTGDCKGASYLPLHAAYAVRYGLAADTALGAITAAAARAFRLDDRIGSLHKGKDADFVVFSGDPFEPTSRVLLVACNGRIVVDNREVRK